MEHDRLQIGDVVKKSQRYFLVTSRALFDLATGKGLDFKIEDWSREQWLDYVNNNYTKSSLEEACFSLAFEAGRKYGLQQALELTKR